MAEGLKAVFENISYRETRGFCVAVAHELQRYWRRRRQVPPPTPGPALVAGDNQPSPPPPTQPPPTRGTGAMVDADSDEAVEYGTRGVKLGLGDFIFYSVLVSMAARRHFVAFVSCALVVLLGLGCTLALLVFAKQALPALPISIVLGLLIYATASVTSVPWTDSMIQQGLVL